MQEKILKEVDKIVSSYENGYVTLTEGLVYSPYQIIRKILFYTNSEYLTGKYDELGKEKPFYNIVNFRNNVAYRATDIDIKNIEIYAENADQFELSFLLNKEFQNWAEDSGFSQFLNEFSETRPKFGGVLVKEVKKDNNIKFEVVSWKNVIVDPVDIESGVIIEKHFMSPSELAEKKDVWNNVNEAIALATKSTKGIYGKAKMSDNRVPIYEIHGTFPEDFDPNVKNPDELVYKDMYFVVAGDGSKKILLWSEEKESPYEYLAWEKVLGRGLGRGVTESAFEAQRWVNEAVIEEKNTLNISGKVLVHTDSNAVGDNALLDYQNGQFIVTEEGKTIRKIDLAPSSLPMYENIKNSWDLQVQRETNTYNAVTGEELPASQTLGATAIATKQASSFFDQKREEAGIFIIKNLIEKRILPFLIKKMNKAHILQGQFSIDELKKLDQFFLKTTLIDSFKKKVLNNEVVYQEDAQMITDEAINQISSLGATRFLNIPENFFKNWKIKTKVVITDENMAKQAEIQNLTTALSLATPEIMQDPTLRALFMELIEKSGTISPIQLANQSPTQKSNVPKPKQPEATNIANQVVPEAQV